MGVNREVLNGLLNECSEHHAQLIAVTKYRSLTEINTLYEYGHKKFGENKVQEFNKKYEELPKDIEWHFIGHLQSNKVKMIIDKAEYIHSVDSIKLAKVINKEAQKINKVQKVFIQVHLAEETTKFGFEKKELSGIFEELSKLKNIHIVGLMTMGTNTDNKEKVRNEFINLRLIGEKLTITYQTKQLEYSMGMSNDYKIALENGSTFVRIGSLLYK